MTESPSEAVLIPPLISAAELAAHLGCNERTVKALASKHRCFHKIGRRMLFTQQDVELLIEMTRAAPTQCQPKHPLDIDMGAIMDRARKKVLQASDQQQNETVAPVSNPLAKTRQKRGATRHETSNS